MNFCPNCGLEKSSETSKCKECGYEFSSAAIKSYDWKKINTYLMFTNGILIFMVLFFQIRSMYNIWYGSYTDTFFVGDTVYAAFYLSYLLLVSSILNVSFVFNKEENVKLERKLTAIFILIVSFIFVLLHITSLGIYG